MNFNSKVRIFAMLTNIITDQQLFCSLVVLRSTDP